MAKAPDLTPLALPEAPGTSLTLPGGSQGQGPCVQMTAFLLGQQEGIVNMKGLLPTFPCEKLPDCWNKTEVREVKRCGRTMRKNNCQWSSIS